MAHTLKNIFQDKVVRHHATEDDDEFQKAFMSSAKKVLRDIQDRTAESPTIVEDHDSDTGLDNSADNCISAGVNWYITEFPIWNVDTKQDLYAVYQRELNRYATTALGTPTGAKGGTP